MTSRASPRSLPSQWPPALSNARFLATRGVASGCESSSCRGSSPRKKRCEDATSAPCLKLHVEQVPCRYPGQVTLKRATQESGANSQALLLRLALTPSQCGPVRPLLSDRLLPHGRGLSMFRTWRRQSVQAACACCNSGVDDWLQPAQGVRTVFMQYWVSKELSIVQTWCVVAWVTHHATTPAARLEALTLLQVETPVLRKASVLPAAASPPGAAVTPTAPALSAAFLLCLAFQQQGRTLTAMPSRCSARTVVASVNPSARVRFCHGHAPGH